MKSAAEEAQAAAASSTGPIDSYTVCMMGAAGVGKAALLSQFRTSECINAYDGGRGRRERDFHILYLYIAKFPHLLSCTYQSKHTILFAKLTKKIHTFFLCSARLLTLHSNELSDTIICETRESFFYWRGLLTIRCDFLMFYYVIYGQSRSNMAKCFLSLKPPIISLQRPHNDFHPLLL